MMFTIMFITISIIELIAITALGLKLYQKNVTIKSLRLSLTDKLDKTVVHEKVEVPTVTDTLLSKENAELKEKLERYHGEASRLNRKIYQLKQELKSKESDAVS